MKIYKGFTQDRVEEVLDILSDGVLLWKDIWENDLTNKKRSKFYSSVEDYVCECSFCEVESRTNGDGCTYCPLISNLFGCKWYSRTTNFTYLYASNKLIRRFCAHKIYKAHVKLYYAYVKYYKKKYSKVLEEDIEIKTIEQLNKITNQMESIHSQIKNDRDVYFDTVDDIGFMEKWETFNEQPITIERIEKIKNLEVHIINNISPELLKLRDLEVSCGDLFSIKQFKEDVESSCIINSDGMGYLVYKDKEVRNVYFYPSLMKHPDIDLTKYSGVMWYNK